MRYNDGGRSKRPTVPATGRILPDYRRLIEDGLLYGIVSLDFVELGRQTYLGMRQAVQGWDADGTGEGGVDSERLFRALSAMPP